VFTGIVEEVGTVRELSRGAESVSLSVAARLTREDVALGDSISVDGTCLTVTALDDGGFTFGLAPETLQRTSLGGLSVGSRVNLERAVRPMDRLGGHIVQGHVDGVTRIVAMQPDGDSLRVSFEAPPELARYVVEKGFVALDGISLTVTERVGTRFAVALVAYTRGHVALVDKEVGDPVNLEVDVLAKYVESILGDRIGSADGQPPRSSVQGGEGATEQHS
jgi:riboflavin synthase